MIRFLIFAALLVTFSLHATDSHTLKCTFKGETGPTDGCSIPTGLDKLGFGNFFDCACNLHDTCYATCGFTKFQCDLKFLEKMAVLCRATGWNFFAQSSCINAALAGFFGVIYFGKQSFINNQLGNKCEKKGSADS